MSAIKLIARISAILCVLVIGLFILQPQKEDALIIGGGGGGGSSCTADVVFLVDTSNSMNACDDSMNACDGGNGQKRIDNVITAIKSFVTKASKSSSTNKVAVNIGIVRMSGLNTKRGSDIVDEIPGDEYTENLGSGQQNPDVGTSVVEPINNAVAVNKDLVNIDNNLSKLRFGTFAVGGAILADKMLNNLTDGYTHVVIMLSDGDANVGFNSINPQYGNPPYTFWAPAPYFPPFLTNPFEPDKWTASTDFSTFWPRADDQTYTEINNNATPNGNKNGTPQILYDLFGYGDPSGGLGGQNLVFFQKIQALNNSYEYNAANRNNLQNELDKIISTCYTPWYSIGGSDARVDAGVNDNPSSGQPIMYIGNYPNNSGSSNSTSNGILFSGGFAPIAPAQIGNQGGTDNWLAGGDSFAENFFNTNRSYLTTSYTNYSKLISNGQLSPTATYSNCDIGVGGTDCLNSIFNNYTTGLFQINGNVAQRGSIRLSNNGHYTILVNGNFFIKNKILVDPSATLTFVVNQKTVVCGNVGEPKGSYQDPGALLVTCGNGHESCDIEGTYSTDQFYIASLFDTPYQSECGNSLSGLFVPDNQLNIGGSVLTNANGNYKYTDQQLDPAKYDFFNERTLLDGNQNSPVFTVDERADFYINNILNQSPFTLSRTNYIWQEVAP